MAGILDSPVTKEVLTGAVPGFICGWLIKQAIRPLAYLVGGGFIFYKYGQSKGWFPQSQYIEGMAKSATSALDVNGDGVIDMADAHQIVASGAARGSDLLKSYGMTGPSGGGFLSGAAVGFFFF